MEIPKNIKDEIWEYCRLNDITDINAFILETLKQGFNIEKYGLTPVNKSNEPTVVEKIVEVPVVKEVEKIVEVPVIKEVERIIEIPLEKIVEVPVSDDQKVNELISKIGELEKTIESLNLEIDKKDTEHNESHIIEKLEQKIRNLEVELELEKNRHLVPQKPEKVPEEKNKRGGLGNIINWISKDERDSKDLYGE